MVLAILKWNLYQEVLLKFNLNLRVNQLQVMVMLLNAVILLLLK